MCFLGCICFTFSEQTYKQISEKSVLIDDNYSVKDTQAKIGFGILLGILFGILNGVNSSLICISAKFLIDEMDSFRANLLIAFYIGAFSFVCALFNLQTLFFDIFDLKFISFGIVNGILVFGAYHFFIKRLNLLIYRKLRISIMLKVF